MSKYNSIPAESVGLRKGRTILAVPPRAAGSCKGCVAALNQRVCDAVVDGFMHEYGFGCMRDDLIYVYDTPTTLELYMKAKLVEE